MARKKNPGTVVTLAVVGLAVVGGYVVYKHAVPRIKKRFKKPLLEIETSTAERSYPLGYGFKAGAGAGTVDAQIAIENAVDPPKAIISYTKKPDLSNLNLSVKLGPGITLLDHQTAEIPLVVISDGSRQQLFTNDLEGDEYSLLTLSVNGEPKQALVMVEPPPEED